MDVAGITANFILGKTETHIHAVVNSQWNVCATTKELQMRGGGQKRLPKFKFSAKFPIGLHVILQIQIKKIENDCYIMWKIILTENPSRCNLAPLLK